MSNRINQDELNLEGPWHTRSREYANAIPQKLKGFMVYTALLNCYAREKDVEKAVATFKKLTDIGVMRSPLVFNILMYLYFQTDGEVVADWNTYCVAADGCLKAGIMEMAMTMLKKLEGQITEKTKSIAFDTLLKLYARKGNKDEVYRIWKSDEKRDKIYNKGYMSMISSLLMLDDIEAAEMMFKKWESRGLSYYFRVPNILINAYCRNNLLEKAGSLIDHAMMKGSEPSADAWYSLASGYLEVEAMKKAILVCPGWKPIKETLASCLDHLEGKGDQNKAEEFIELLRTENIFSPVAHNRLRTYIKGLKSQSDGLL
uniref:Pentacotripeptide-repeat region of PRORP domain-containing protein n=1 Tax=Populus trichocarpa TaxID=3694 RepID=A0A2K1YFV7_POPTR